MESISNSEPNHEIINDDDDDDDELIEASPDRNDRQKERDRAFDDSNKKTPEKQPAKSPEIPERHDKDVPVDKLDKDEKKLVADQYIQARQPEIGEELLAAVPETPEEAELLATAALLESIGNKLAAGEAPTDRSLDESVAEIMRDLGIETPHTPAESAVEDTVDPPQNEMPLEKVIGPEAVDPQQEELEDIADSPSSGNPRSPRTPPAIPAARGNIPSPASVAPNSGGNNPPPVLPPYQRQPASYNHLGGGLPFTPNFYTASPNIMPINPASNLNQNQAPSTVERRSAALPYLVVGYLLGRRKGRIKTEKKLAPVQKKLEKEITNLHINIAAREEKIRKLVREQVAAKPATAEVMVKRLTERKEQKTRPTKMARLAMESTRDVPAKSPMERIAMRPEKHYWPAAKPVAEEVATIVPNAVGRTAPRPVLEATPLPFKHSERIGKFAVEYETPPLPHTLPATPRSPELPTFPKIYQSANLPNRPKSPDTLVLTELLEIASRIPAEHLTVKKLFESHQLDEAGLRRVTKAFLQGERYDKAVKENIRSHDTIAFERNFEQVSRPTASAIQHTTNVQRGVSSTSAHSGGQSTISHNAYTPNLKPIELKKKPAQNKKTTMTTTGPLAVGIIIAVLLLLLVLR